MSILLIDFNNMVHRARAGFGRGEHPVTYTFFLILRKTIEKFSPSQVYIVKEGKPQRRHDTLEGYKANRASAGDDFWRQHSDISEMLKSMPVKIVRHPFRECDDTIAHFVNVVHANEPCTIVSTDSDFIQLLKVDSTRVQLWNPIKDTLITAPDYDYVSWKSLTGDGSDNIPGFKGIGGKTAEKLLANPQKLNEFLAQDNNLEKFQMNYGLIQFHTIDEGVEHLHESVNWESVRNKMTELGFSSIVNDKSWKKFVNTFDCVKE